MESVSGPSEMDVAPVVVFSSSSSSVFVFQSHSFLSRRYNKSNTKKVQKRKSTCKFDSVLVLPWVLWIIPFLYFLYLHLFLHLYRVSFGFVSGFCGSVWIFYVSSPVSILDWLVTVSRLASWMPPFSQLPLTPQPPLISPPRISPHPHILFLASSYPFPNSTTPLPGFVASFSTFPTSLSDPFVAQSESPPLPTARR